MRRAAKQFIALVHFANQTPTAVRRVRDLLAQKNDPEVFSSHQLGLKVGVRKRGCNGLSYTLNYARDAEPLDEVVQVEGLRVIVDAKALLVLVGTEMDFVEDEVRSEFVFRNPNAKGQCGCGESFHI